jgi:hypothetical protein
MTEQQAVEKWNRYKNWNPKGVCNAGPPCPRCGEKMTVLYGEYYNTYFRCEVEQCRTNGL